MMLSKKNQINLNTINNFSVISDGNPIILVFKSCIHFYERSLNKLKTLK